MTMTSISVIFAVFVVNCNSSGSKLVRPHFLLRRFFLIHFARLLFVCNDVEKVAHSTKIIERVMETGFNPKSRLEKIKHQIRNFNKWFRLLKLEEEREQQQLWVEKKALDEKLHAQKSQPVEEKILSQPIDTSVKSDFDSFHRHSTCVGKSSPVWIRRSSASTLLPSDIYFEYNCSPKSYRSEKLFKKHAKVNRRSDSQKWSANICSVPNNCLKEDEAVWIRQSSLSSASCQQEENKPMEDEVELCNCNCTSSPTSKSVGFSPASLDSFSQLSSNTIFTQCNCISQGKVNWKQFSPTKSVMMRGSPVSNRHSPQITSNSHSLVTTATKKQRAAFQRRLIVTEWCILASVVDRFLFWIFLIGTISAYLYIFVVLPPPGWKQDKRSTLIP